MKQLLRPAIRSTPLICGAHAAPLSAIRTTADSPVVGVGERGCAFTRNPSLAVLPNLENADKGATNALREMQHRAARHWSSTAAPRSQSERASSPAHAREISPPDCSGPNSARSSAAVSTRKFGAHDWPQRLSATMMPWRDRWRGAIAKTRSSVVSASPRSRRPLMRRRGSARPRYLPRCDGRLLLPPSSLWYPQRFTFSFARLDACSTLCG